jgi:hypothetical protein
MAARDDDEEIDLGISLAAIATIVDHARALHDSEEAGADERDDETDGGANLAEEIPDDLTEDSLREFIEELNEDEQAALIALVWIGRGDYEAEDWDEAVRLAAERNENGDAADYLVGMDLLGDLLSEGIASFGLSLEDVER